MTETQADCRNKMLTLALRTVTNAGLIAPGIDADQSWRRSTWFGRCRSNSSSVCLPNLQVLEQLRAGADKSRRLEQYFASATGASRVFTNWLPCQIAFVDPSEP